MDSVAINAVVAADGSGRITQFNPAAQRTFGYTESEVLGQSVTRLICPRDRDTYRSHVEQLFSSEDAANAGRTLELHGCRKDGTEFPVELCLLTWRAAAGSLYTCVVRDISKRKQTERERDALLRRVEAI